MSLTVELRSKAIDDAHSLTVELRSEVIDDVHSLTVELRSKVIDDAHSLTAELRSEVIEDAHSLTPQVATLALQALKAKIKIATTDLITRVYSWNTYPARLSVRCQIDSACIFVYVSTSCVADRNYHVRFRKGWSHETDNRK